MSPPLLEKKLHPDFRPRLGALLILSILLSVPGVALAEANTDPISTDLDPNQRVVAIADIHGAFDPLRYILRQADLIDEEDRWVGGRTILVQTGDFLDRGAESVAVARFLRRLQQEAPESGGRVIVLLGNHEVLNMINDLRYVTNDILTPFIDEESEKRYRKHCNDYAKFLRRQAARSGADLNSQRQAFSECKAKKAFGILEYIEALGPNGELGQWLRTLPAVAQLGNVVFLHGGVSPSYVGRSVDSINAEVAAAIASFDAGYAYLLEQKAILPTSSLSDIVRAGRTVAERATDKGKPVPPEVETLIDFPNSILVHNQGPLWFRGYAKWDDEQGRTALPPILESLGARHIVVGHTPQHSHDIVPRFDDSIFLIDTGMLTNYYEGRASALEIQGGAFRALYANGEPQVIYRTE